MTSYLYRCFGAVACSHQYCLRMMLSLYNFIYSYFVEAAQDEDFKLPGEKKTKEWMERERTRGEEESGSEDSDEDVLMDEEGTCPKNFSRYFQFFLLNFASLSSVVFVILNLLFKFLRLLLCFKPQTVNVHCTVKPVFYGPSVMRTPPTDEHFLRRFDYLMFYSRSHKTSVGWKPAFHEKKIPTPCSTKNRFYCSCMH